MYCENCYLYCVLDVVLEEVVNENRIHEQVWPNLIVQDPDHLGSALETYPGECGTGIKLHVDSQDPDIIWIACTDDISSIVDPGTVY